MSRRKGLAPIYTIVLLLITCILSVVVLTSLNTATESPGDTNGASSINETADDPDETTDEQTSGHQFYQVTEMTVNGTIIPAGTPLEITAKLTKVRGEDPFNVEFSISGEVMEERQVFFGDSDQIEETFTVRIDRQGRYEVHMGGFRQGFEVREEPPQVEWLNISPREVAVNETITVTFGARNLNKVPLVSTVYVEVIPMNFHHPVSLLPGEYKEFSFDLSREGTGVYTLRIDGLEQSFNITGTHVEHHSEQEFVYTPINYIPDPITWNMTSILPPGSSPLRLSLPVPIDSFYGKQWAGVGGIGVHAGGHIEGLDHVWIESTTTEPVKSWADGEVTQIQYSGDVDHGEYHITIEYGFNLTGIHMEIETPLVEVGDFVLRGDPVGYGMVWFDGLQSAEQTLIDSGRTDGIKAGDGVYVSPFDYLMEPEKIALADAYIKNVVEPFMESGEVNGQFDPAQPYFTNNLLIHHGHEGKLQGEWYLISENWTAGYPNDLVTIIEPHNRYTDQPKIMGMDDHSEGGVANWGFFSDLSIDYESGKLWFYNWDREKTYGIFEIDESTERATLKLQYQTGGYPTGFTDDALVYIERTYLSRREDGALLGVVAAPQPE